MGLTVTFISMILDSFIYYTPSGKKKNKVMLRKATKCVCISNALAFLFPSLKGPPEV